MLESIAEGIKVITHYDNIAIVVLTIMCVLQWVVIGRLIATVLKIGTIFQPLMTAISILNERLNKHD